ncbi:MAG: efflux RND transporter periplasmic adaptor subunit [Proteobacteria bacterium]|nr:efflux RND transporter periplasmic adaptor subunit [Pseudomonadota bacterium]MBU1454629.1 efflux RND transporter periplasmic adaptor subunit [Pseudomonadota bacterium]
MQQVGMLDESIKKMLLVAGLLGAFLLAGCDRNQEALTERPDPQVSYITVQPEKIMLSTKLPGRSAPFRVAEIRPQISGLIQKRLFTEGSNVKAGQVLYQIDPAPTKAAFDNANAALGRAKSSLPSVKARAERLSQLVADKAVSQQDYDDAAAALIQVEADIRYYQASAEAASINLGYTKVTAPISGRIGKSSVTDGAIVTAYQTMALSTIQQMDPIYIDVPQSTTELLRLKRRLKEGLLSQNENDQNKVDLFQEDGTPYPLEGILQFSDVTVDQSTGSVTLRALFPNPDEVILPGMFVQAMIREGVNEQAILIPQQGVSRDPKGNPFALIVDAESKAGFRPLTLDRAIGDKWLVSAGLAPGDRVIVEGLLMLRPGTVVNATPFEPVQTGQGPAAKVGASSKKPSEGGV